MSKDSIPSPWLQFLGLSISVHVGLIASLYLIALWTPSGDPSNAPVEFSIQPSYGKYLRNKTHSFSSGSDAHSALISTTITSPEKKPESSEKRGILTNPAITQGSLSESVRVRYLAELQARIEKEKVFPSNARVRKLEGEVLVSFVVEANGTVKDVKIESPCPHSKLNQAALQLIQGLGRVAPIPEALKVRSLAMRVPIRYQSR